mgnify:CR=1 FL=1
MLFVGLRKRTVFTDGMSTPSLKRSTTKRMRSSPSARRTRAAFLSAAGVSASSARAGMPC